MQMCAKQARNSKRCGQAGLAGLWRLTPTESANGGSASSDDNDVVIHACLQWAGDRGENSLEIDYSLVFKGEINFRAQCPIMSDFCHRIAEFQ
jgi:hypothetical protein